jgi:hypothetical protein
MGNEALHRAVQLTARSSALFFAAAQTAHAMGPRRNLEWRPLYLGFMAAHAMHFAVVARYAKATGGRGLFPGGKSLNQVGGWPTVAAIYGIFSGLAWTGWVAGRPSAAKRRGVRLAGRIAVGVIGAMYVGTYLGQLHHSAWKAVPAAAVGAAVIASISTGIHPSGVSARWVADPTRVEASAS